jgi:glycine betaine/proline transport system substrate-binding protein
MKLFGKLLWAGAVSAMVTLSASAIADTKPTLKLGYVEGWDDSVATSNVAARVIEKKLGYHVQLVPVAAGIMARRGARRPRRDAVGVAARHARLLLERIQDEGRRPRRELSGREDRPDRSGLREGEDIDDLNAEKSSFGGRIVGIDAGAGVMRKTDEAIKSYGLSYTLMPSSGSAMTAELSRSVGANKPVIVTGWAPHWMFAKWKLRFLDDPKKVFGGAEHVDSVVNPQLETKAKPVVAFLKKFQWKPGEIDSVMLAIQNGSKPDAAADAWIAAHADRVNAWTEGAQ